MAPLLLLLYVLLMQWHLISPLSLDGNSSNDVENRLGQYQRYLLVSPTNRRFQREAMQAWSKTLTENDYNNEHWPKLLGDRSGPPQYFDYYIVKLSKIFAKYNAQVNFVSIGACDGTNDRTIERYLSFPHWQAMFIEPVSNNFAALEKFLKDNEVEHRSFALNAAATDLCKSPTVKIQRPLYEEKGKAEGKEVPHWLRRQIGGILPDGKIEARAEWILEEVKCVTARDALNEWANAVSPNAEGITNLRRRPHILKLDVEGHDYEVMMGFLQENTPVSELPLLISFEAKSLGDTKFRLAKVRMEKLGYAVAKFANDGFALLRGDRMLARSGSGEAGKMVITSSSDNNFDEDNVDRRQKSTELAAAPTADIELSSNDMRGPPEDENPDP